MAAWLPWLMWWLPFAAAAGIVCFSLKRPERAAAWSVTAGVASFFCALALWALGFEGEATLFWATVPGLSIDLGWRVDGVSRLTALIVASVAALIQIYSLGYMRGDRGRARYFAGLSFFTFAMLGIVLTRNLLAMFVFWELTGVSSYLLIGHWRERPAAAEAAKKAFLVDRLGDWGFLLGIAAVWAIAGTLDLDRLAAEAAARPDFLGAWSTAIGLLLFCGAAGKSAQFPLHVWLPDAMEGPTPVSALIHAATMVAAGVFMLCRVFFLLDLPDSAALDVITWVGAVTAFLAALMAVQQDDIKRVLAYSTVSQLGCMVMAVGLSKGSGNPSPALFHLATHAFFMALLFLGAGAVIHALGYETQDMWQMGGLWKRMPATFWPFFLATLALCGLPPLSGGVSKEAILSLAASRGAKALLTLGLFVAFLTSLYMFRLFFTVFFGPSRSRLADAASDPLPVMRWPMWLLAVPTVFAGGWGMEGAYAAAYVAAGRGARPEAAGGSAVVLLSLGAMAAGLLLAWVLYFRAAEDPVPKVLGRCARCLRQRLYIDWLYERAATRALDAAADLARGMDRWVIAGACVRGLHGAIDLAGRALRLVQSGNLQTEALMFVGGAALLLLILFVL